MSDSLQPHELHCTRPPCTSPAPGVHPNPCPLSRWCHPTILSSVIPFSSCPQFLPASGSFPISQLFAWGGQISPFNEHPGLISFRMDWLGLLAVQGTFKSLLQHHHSKASVLWCSAFFIVQIGNQSWLFIERIDAEAETPILWPPNAKSQHIGKYFDDGKDWGQEEKGATEDEMAGQHHWFNGHEFEQIPGESEGPGSLVCCNPWGCKELDMTERLNNNNKSNNKITYVWNLKEKDTNELLYQTETDSQTENKPMVTKGEEGEINLEFVINRYTLLYMRLINNKDLWHIIGNYIQCL